GKGMPAALLMVAVRTLCRHLAKEAAGPAELLRRLDVDLAADNPACMFVTLAHGTYDPAGGDVVLTSGGHPLPLLRRADGRVEPVVLKPGRLLGYDTPPLRLAEARLTLAPGDLLLFFTDGLIEAKAPDGRTLFGTDRVAALVRDFTPSRSLSDCA